MTPPPLKKTKPNSLPKPPDDDPLLQARMLANAIRTGFPGADVANIAFAQMGADYIRTCAMQTAEEVIEGYRADPETWPLFAPHERLMKRFFDSFIGQCQTLLLSLPPEVKQ